MDPTHTLARNRPPDPPRWSPSPLRRLLRHRGAYWTIAAALAGLAALGVAGLTADARRTLDELGRTGPAVVMEETVEPGDTLAGATTERQVPLGLLPDGALDQVPPDAVAARTIPAGTITCTGWKASTSRNTPV